MASTAANRARSSTNGAPAAMHLGLFSRNEIADFDSKGRYPTTPSPQETRAALPTPTYNWFAPEATALLPPLNLTKTQNEDRADDSNVTTLSNGQLTPPDGDQQSESQSVALPPAQDPLRQGPRASGDSNSPPSANSGPQGPRPFPDSLQDSARASLPPGPRHPQAPSRPTPPLQTVQPQSSQRIGSKPLLPYPYSPATTAKPLVNNSPSQPPMSTPLNYGTTLQVQNLPGPQVAPPPEEICIECMMRDRDMADVIVIGPGIWDRESDIHLRELIDREDEEERAWRERHAAELAVPGNRLRPPRRASKGHRLTEQNLKLWMSMNPKEAHARLLTIDSYIRQQATLLVIEAEARAKTEALQVEARLSDGYPRQSTHEAVLDDSKSGTRIAGPRSSVYSGPSVMLGDEYGHHRDTTILENGMIVERFDVKRGERDRRREGKKASKSSTSTTRDYLPPMTPSGGQMEFAGSGSDYEPPHPAMSSTSLQQSRPTSAPLAVPGPFASNLSVDGRSPRFMGSKHWQAPWSSAASQAPTGSMVDMHLGLDQEHDLQMGQFGASGTISRHHAMSSFSLPATPRHQFRPHTADAMMHLRRSTSPDPKARKPSGFAKLWRMVRSKKSEGKHQTNSYLSPPPDEDMNMPLPPPPKMSYLASQRSPHSRQLSTPGSQNGVSPSSHPRSVSQPGQYSTATISPTTAASSTLPSPTSNRFLWRESAGEDRRQSAYKEINGIYKDVNADTETERVVLDPESNAPTQHGEVNGSRAPITTGSGSSEYGRMLQLSNSAPLTRSPAPSTLVSSSVHSPRPASSVHKPLPPPPPSEQGMRPMSSSTTTPYNMTRPNTILNPNEAFLPPGPLRDDAYDSRRQSFGGMTTRPDFLPPGAAQGLQTKRSIPGMTYTDSPTAYQEFGIPYERGYAAAPYSNGTLSDGTKAKRRSRFMLPFLSKKEKEKPALAPQPANGDAMRYSTYAGPVSSQFLPPSRAPFSHSQKSRSSASLTVPDFAPGMMNSAATTPYSQPFGFNDSGRPISGASTFVNGQRPNKLLIDEVVPRDNEFVAYRYPSTEQTLDITRR